MKGEPLAREPETDKTIPSLGIHHNTSSGPLVFDTVAAPLLPPGKTPEPTHKDQRTLCVSAL